MGIINDILMNVEKSLLGDIQGALSGQSKHVVSGEFIPGDVDIIDITLLSEDQQRKYSLLSQCKSFNIYESILSPVIFAELSIADSIGLLQNFPIIGEEYVSITFNTPSSKQPAVYTMRVNRVKNKKIAINVKMTTYTIELVSAELFRNSSRLVTKQFEGAVSDSVKDIFENELGTEKKISIEDTRGIDASIVTRMQPLKAIDFFRRRAVSKKYQSSSFVCFENRFGYNFITIENLFETGSKSGSSSDKVFWFDNSSNKVNSKGVTVRNIIAYNQVGFVDSVSKIQHGGITNIVNRFDLVTGDFKKITYTNNEAQDKFKFGDEKSTSLNSSTFDRLHGKVTAKTKLVPYSSDKAESFLPEKLNFLQAFTQKISQNLVQIEIYGDTDLTVGDIITCNLPAATGQTGPTENARLDSGNYLISKLRHMVINGDRPQHIISMELIKGSFLESA